MRKHVSKWKWTKQTSNNIRVAAGGGLSSCLNDKNMLLNHVDLRSRTEDWLYDTGLFMPVFLKAVCFI